MPEMTEQLGIIAMDSAKELGKRADEIIREWRGGESRLIEARCPRFASGEGKGIIEQSVRDKDLYLITDVTNNSLTYMMDGSRNRMSPDDHYQDLKRVIAACNGSAARINVIMPFLYESRQHRRTMRESLDCGVMLQELEGMGVHSLITFDAHDPRVQHAVPLMNFENVSPALQFSQMLLAEYEDLILDREHMMFIAPDEGATGRVVFMASLFGLNIGMFYKRRDYTVIVDGTNPIVAHEFCGESPEGKDCIVIDDMIASGGSIIDVARQLKERGARRIFLFATFGLFTHGMDRFDRGFENGWFTRVFTTNLAHLKPEALEREYFCPIRMDRYVAALINHMNKGESLTRITRPESRIIETAEKYRAAHNA